MSKNRGLRRTTDFSGEDTYLIYEYFRPNGSFDEVQGLSGLFSINLVNDDIQDFDLRWEQLLLLTSDPPSDKDLEGLYVPKLQESFQAQTIMALHNQEILRGGGTRYYHRLTMCVKLHIEQAQRSKKIRIHSEITERAAYLKEEGKIPSPCGRQESAFSGRQVGPVQKENLAVFSIRVLRETERKQRKKW